MPGRKRSEFRFDAALAVQQAELVQLIAKESLAGGKAKGKVWSDLDRLHKQALVAQPRAVSIEQVDPNSIAGRARRKYGTARTFGKPRGGSTLQSQPRSTRVRCLPITRLPDARRLPAAASGTSRGAGVESKHGDSEDVIAAARNASRSAPSWSIASRRRPPEDIRREREAAQSSAAAAAPGRSSLGNQALSTKTSAPAPSFSKLGRDQAVRALAAGSLDTPSAQHYHPNDTATSTARTARAARLAGRAGSPSHSQSMVLRGAHAVPGPGHYAAAPGQGPQALSSRRSAPGVSFGAGFVASSSHSSHKQSLSLPRRERGNGGVGGAGGSLSQALPPTMGGRGVGSSRSIRITGIGTGTAGFIRGSQSLSSLGASYVMVNGASGSDPRFPPAERARGASSLAASMGPAGRPPVGPAGGAAESSRQRSQGLGRAGEEDEEQGWDLYEPPARRARRAAKAVQGGESAELAQRMRIRKLQQERLVAARNARQPLPPRRRQPAARHGESLETGSSQTGHGAAASAREQRAGEDVHVLADRVLAESARYLDSLNPTEHGS